MKEKTERKLKETGKIKGGKWKNIVKLSIVKWKIRAFYVQLNEKTTL